MKISLFKLTCVAAISVFFWRCTDLPNYPTTPVGCTAVNCITPQAPATITCDLAYQKTEIKPQDIFYIPSNDPQTGRRDPKEINSEEFISNLEVKWDSISKKQGTVKITTPCDCDKGIILIDYEGVPNPIGFEDRREVAESTAEEENTEGQYSPNKRFRIGAYSALQPLSIGDENPKTDFSSYNKDDVVEVGIIDSGIDLWGSSFQKNIWRTGSPTCGSIDVAGYDFATSGTLPLDSLGHGSLMGGIISKAEIIEPGITSPPDDKIRLMNLKISSDSTIDLVSALCAISFAAQEGVEIINLSWGYYAEKMDSVLYQAIADNPGILFITSAGNDALDTDVCFHWPSNLSRELDHVISVGALNKSQDGLAVFSNFGQETVNILATGTNVISHIPVDCCFCSNGTSMAAAYVTRLAAILKLKEPKLSGQELKQRILEDVGLNKIQGIPLINDKILIGEPKVCN